MKSDLQVARLMQWRERKGAGKRRNQSGRLERRRVCVSDASKSCNAAWQAGGNPLAQSSGL